MPPKAMTDAEFRSQEATLAQNVADSRQNLESSPTYWSQTAEPSSQDLIKDAQYRGAVQALEDLRSKKASETWYGPGGSEESMVAKPREGLIMKGLNILSTPLYATVGAAKYLTGQAEGKSIFESANETIKARETFGTLLQEMHVPVPIAMPLGFALDVFADPVNIALLGTAGVFGKIGRAAFTKGGAGAMAATRSVGWEGVRSMVNLVPDFVSKTKKAEMELMFKTMEARGLKAGSPEVVEYIAKTVNPKATWAGRVQQAVYGTKTGIQKAALAATEDYRKITGETVDNMLDRLANRKANKIAMQSYARGIIEKIPGGEKMLDLLDYNSSRWYHGALLKDKMINFSKQIGLYTEKALTEDEVRVLRQNFEELQQHLPDRGSLYLENLKGSGKVQGDILNELDDVVNLSKEGTNITRAENSFDAVSRLQGEITAEDAYSNMLAAMKEFSADKGAGVDALNKIYDKINNFKVGNAEVGKNILDKYAQFIGLFKSSKLGPLSPASMLYATVGNAAMTHLFGINMLRSDFYKNVYNSWKYLRGKTAGEIGEILTKDISKIKGAVLSEDVRIIRQFAAEFPGTFAKLFGFSMSDAWRRGVIDRAMQEGIKTGVFATEEVAITGRKEMEDIFAALQKTTFKKFNLSKETRATTYSELERNIVRARALKTKAQLTAEEAEFMKIADQAGWLERAGEIGGGPVGVGAGELNIEPFIRLRNSVKASAETGNPFAKLLNFALDQSREYELIDQSYRLGLFVTLTKDGVSEKEIRHIVGGLGFGITPQGLKITPKDFSGTIETSRGKYWKFTPEKAGELVLETFMNYAAMPAAVKILRQMPILGFPFFSFSYAMALKTGKAFMFNPSAFNKVNFLLSEIAKDKSPLEKESLKSKYYAWYNQPGMLNLGNALFFKDNPIYLNVANMIPYLTMNMFMPSERKFEEGWRGALASTIDNIPFLKDPLGAILVDYFIIPSIIRDTQPQNQWGGPLYPADSPLWKKYFAYPLRQLAESVVPTSIAALAPITPESLVPILPSFPWRKLTEAIHGKTAVGVMGKEDPASRTFRGALGIMGVPLYPQNLQYLTSQVKKSIKK